MPVPTAKHFGEQFKYVSGSSGAEQVGANEEFKIHVKTNLPITKSGYLYVYVSNELRSKHRGKSLHKSFRDKRPT